MGVPRSFTAEGLRSRIGQRNHGSGWFSQATFVSCFVLGSANAVIVDEAAGRHGTGSGSRPFCWSSSGNGLAVVIKKKNEKGICWTEQHLTNRV